jgi:hypothetical protein
MFVLADSYTTIYFAFVLSLSTFCECSLVIGEIAIFSELTGNVSWEVPFGIWHDMVIALLQRQT